MWKPLTPVLVAMLAVLAGCSQAPEAPQHTASDAAALQRPSQADIDRFIAEGPEHAARELRPLDYWLHYKMMQATGIEAALGGEEQTIAALKAMGEAYERRLRSLEGDMPKVVPAAFTGDGIATGLVGMGMGLSTSFTLGALAVGALSEDIPGPELKKRSNDLSNRAARNGGRAEVKLDDDGSLELELEMEIDEDGIEGRTKVKMQVEACPDPEGKMTVVIDTDSSMRLAGSDGTGGFVRSQYRLDVYLDNDARLIEGHNGNASDFHVEMGGFDNYDARFMDRSIGIGRDGKPYGGESNSSGFNILFRPEEVSLFNSLVSHAFKTNTLFAHAVLRGLGTGQELVWESGRCVKLELSTDPAKRTGQHPNTTYTIEAKPRAKSDGAPTGGTVKATLNGGAKLDRDGVKVPADAQYTYTAPAKKDESASITFEARSKRGVGRATLAFDTKEKQAYHFSCGGHDPIEQDVCDINTPFVLNGKMFGNELSGGLTGTTKIVRSPNVPGMRWSGTGTYAITFPDGEDKPGTMHVNAGGTTSAGSVSRHTTGEEMCTLTPLEECK